MIWKICTLIEDFDPEISCVLTEGPLGIVPMLHMNNFGRHFSSMWCTQADMYCRKLSGEWCRPPAPF
jgi:hypothetical protein